VGKAGGLSLLINLDSDSDEDSPAGRHVEVFTMLVDTAFASIVGALSSRAPMGLPEARDEQGDLSGMLETATATEAGEETATTTKDVQRRLTGQSYNPMAEDARRAREMSVTLQRIQHHPVAACLASAIFAPETDESDCTLFDEYFQITAYVLNNTPMDYSASESFTETFESFADAIISDAAGLGLLAKDIVLAVLWGRILALLCASESDLNEAFVRAHKDDLARAVLEATMIGWKAGLVRADRWVTTTAIQDLCKLLHLAGKISEFGEEIASLCDSNLQGSHGAADMDRHF
jgi:hypothetical protein